MQENRSFDHYFGTMRGVRGFADPRAVKLPSGQSVWHQPWELGPSPAVPSRRRGSRPDVSAGPASWLERHARRLERGQVRSMGAEQGCDDDDVSHPEGSAVPVRAGGCLHHLRQLLLLADGADRPQSLSHVDRLGRQRRRRGGPVITNAEAGYDWSTYPERLERAGISWKVYQDVGVGLDAGGFLGLDRRSLHRQLRGQLAPLLPSIPVRAARNAARRQGARPAPTSWRSTASRSD